MNKFLFGATLFFYFLATFHYLLYLMNQRESIGKVCKLSTILGFAFHTLLLIYQTVSAGRIPLASIRESMVFFSWAIVFIFLILEYRVRTRVLGAFIIPIAFALILVSLTFPVTPLPGDFSSSWLGVHTSLAFIGDAAFAVAFGLGIMYIIQERRLKRKNPGAFYRHLPPLEMLDELEYKAVALGFPLFTLAIISGAMWANSAWGSYWGWEPKEVWSLFTWLIYAAYLHARLVAGWRGRKAAYMAVIGFVIVLFTFIGVNLLLPGRHAFK